MNLQDLNEMQRKAAQTLEGPLLILAGAGSGKTRTVTYRIANLLAHNVPAYKILALTFTNKAAREMRERVEKLVGDSAKDMWIGTFHSVCVRILRKDIEKLGYKRSFTIYDDDDQSKVIKDILKKLNIDDKSLTYREVKGKISDAKNHIYSPDEWFSHSDRSYKSQQIHDVFVQYEGRLRNANALDFDDILLRTLQLFFDHPPVLDYYKNKFSYVHVDEYQDTNVAQYQLVRLLTEDSRNLCVVGDDDQSIYGWRGADLRNILEFEKDFQDATVIKLEQNYRSTSNILDAANQVIAHNKGRKEKVLWTEENEGEKIRLYTAGDEREEAAWICESIRKYRTNGGDYSDIAVLYRMHAQSRVIEEMFMRSGIPYRVYGGTRFYDRREIKDVLAYLRVMVNPSDTVSLKRIINIPKRAIGDATVHQLEQEAEREDISLFDTLTQPPETLSSRPKKCVKEFARLIYNLMLLKDEMPLSEFVQKLLDETGLSAQFQNEDIEENRTRMENLMEFVGATKEFEQKSEDKTLEAYLENVALVTDLDNQDTSEKFVTLMTLHSAKGLEYKAVFLAGLEENVFPSARSMGDETRFEEERRLCYVGITRAREQLYLSGARQRTIFNQVSYNAPSLFIKEIPERLINDEWAQADRASFAPRRENIKQEIKQRKEQRMISFGTPGMGQRENPLQIPGVTKGFVPSKAQAFANSAVKTLFQKGDRVLHRKFGEGTVIALEGTGSEARIVISFTAYGNKEFALSIAPIVKINV